MTLTQWENKGKKKKGLNENTIMLKTPALSCFSTNAVIIRYTNRSNTIANEHTGFDLFLISSCLQWFSLIFNVSPGVGSCQVCSILGRWCGGNTSGTNGSHVFACSCMSYLKAFKTNLVGANPTKQCINCRSSFDCVIGLLDRPW